MIYGDKLTPPNISIPALTHLMNLIEVPPAILSCPCDVFTWKHDNKQNKKTP